MKGQSIYFRRNQHKIITKLSMLPLLIWGNPGVKCWTADTEVPDSSPSEVMDGYLVILYLFQQYYSHIKTMGW